MDDTANEKALKIIEQQFTGFINLSNSWGFFRGLAEYVKTIEQFSQFKPMLEALETQQRLANSVLEQLNNQAFLEFTRSAERIRATTDSIAKQFEPVAKAIREVEDRLKGLTLSSDPLHGLDHDLFDVARALRKVGHPELVKEFEDPNKKVKNVYGEYTFSPTYEKIQKEKDKVERQEQVEPWGAWYQLPLVKRLVFEPEELIEEYKKEAEKDPQSKWNYWGLLGIVSEMESIRKGNGSDDKIVFFRVSDFKDFAQRFHNYITTELLKPKEVKVDQKPSKQVPASFRPRLIVENGIGHLQVFKQSKKHPIGKVGTRKFRLMQVLFSAENSVDADYAPSYQKYDRVFEAIQIERDKKNARLTSSTTARTAMCDIIKFTIKELQGIKALQGYLGFDWNGHTLQMNIEPSEGSSTTD